MRFSWIGVGVLAIGLVRCSSFPDDPCANSSASACQSDGGPTADGTVGDGGGDVVQPPVGCDPAADPKDSAACVVDEYGVFVDATGGADAPPPPPHEVSIGAARISAGKARQGRIRIVGSPFARW